MTAAPWRQLLRTRAAAANHEPARPAALYAYTAAVIVAGFGALVLATALVPLGPRIALPFPGDAGIAVEAPTPPDGDPDDLPAGGAR